MPPIALWWRATRPFAFSASVFSAILGGLVAVAHGGARLHWGHFMLAIAGAASAHAAANLMNDYFDHRKGVDRPGTLGSSGVLTAGLMTPRAVLLEFFVCAAVAAGLGLYLLSVTGRVLLPLLAAGLVLGAGYTAAPAQFKYRGLGDAAVFLAFGVGITLGSYAVQTGQLSWVAFAYSVPASFLVTAILHGNNMRDMESDRRAAIRTLAMSLGRVPAWRLYLALLVLAYLSLAVFVVAGWIAPGGMLALLTLPIAYQIARHYGAAACAAPTYSPSGANLGLAQIDVATARLHLLFGLLLSAGVLIRALV